MLLARTRLPPSVATLHRSTCGHLRRPVTTGSTSSSAGFSKESSVKAAAMHERARAVLDYWFGPAFPDWPHDKMEQQEKWFKGGEETDAYIKKEFGADVEAIAAGKYDKWLQSSLVEGLAGVLLMDQFTRNMYRGTAQMYSLDDKATTWAGRLSQQPDFPQLHPAGKMFIAMPFMHTESLEGQQKCIQMARSEGERLAREYGDDNEAAKACANTANFGQKHLDIIEKWGRFPHRNQILGRESTDAELQGLQDGSIGSF